MKIARFTLLCVVFLDIMSQGLVIPILTTLMMDPASGFLPAGTDAPSRQATFGLVMGIFFLSWFLGAAYISKLSDSIGRKAGILVCLFGALIGYGLTIVALDMQSLPLLILARVISGFTAGNQPIAQAALVDMSENEKEKTRFMGLVLVALSLGLVGGPLISGVLSDTALVGQYASLDLPFYFVSLLVLLNILMVVVFFHDQPMERQKFVFRPQEVVLTLWHAAQRPVILKLSLVFFCGQLALNAFFVFLDSVLFARFQFDTLQNSIALVVFGGAMGFSSAFLVGPVNERYAKPTIIAVCLGLMAISQLLFVFNPSPVLAYVLIVPFVVPFAVYYPTMLTLFSSAVGEDEQGWVMGVTVALFTLAAAIISLAGGRLMAFGTDVPFMVSVAVLVLGVLLVTTLWRGDDFRALDQR